MKQLRKMKGFTLIELMIVIVIIMIMAAVTIPRIIDFSNNRAYAPQQLEVITQDQEKALTAPEVTKPKSDKEETKKL